MKFKALLLDFDGTVIDSESILFESWKKVFKEYDLNLQVANWAKFFRLQRPHASAYYYLQEHVADLPAPEIIQTMQRQYEQVMMNRVPMRQGIEELILKCKSDSAFRIAIVSASKLEWIIPHLKRVGISEKVDLVVSREDCEGRLKPDSFCYELALKRLSCNAIDAIAVEDSPSGIDAAKNAGIRTIAFPNPVTVYIDLAKADACFEDGNRIFQWIHRNGK